MISKIHILLIALVFPVILASLVFTNTFGLRDLIQSFKRVQAETNALYVSLNGVDSNSGTIAAPFKTIQKCASVATQGYTCYIREGIYRETVTPGNSGTSTQPIAFKPYNNEQVTISGTEIIPPSSWTLDSGSIYKAEQVPNIIGTFKNQVFVNGVMVPEARWPNQTSTNPFQPTYAIAEDASYSPTTGGSITINTLPNSPNDWRGAWINQLGKYEWYTYTGADFRRVTGNTFSFGLQGIINAEQYPTKGEKFYLFGVKEALDSPGEWFFDYANAKNILYLWDPKSINPSGSTVEMKKRLYGFDLSGKSYIIVQGLKFFATSIQTDSASSNITLDGISASYITHHMVDEDMWNNPNSGIRLLGTNNTIKNSEISFSAGNGIRVEGTGHVITNNKIHDIDYLGDENAAIRLTNDPVIHPSQAAKNITITNNTIYNTGKAIIDGEIQASKIQYNDFYSGGLLNSDFGLIYLSGDSQNTEIAYNRIHDNKAAAYGGGIYLESWNASPPHPNQNVNIHHNTIWNNWANIQINRNANDIQISNNTLWKSTFADILSNSIFNPSTLTNIKILNNIVEPDTATVKGFQIYNADWNSTTRINNLQVPNPGFADATANNYQLLATSPAVTSGVGAYAYGSFPWAAGYTPPNGLPAGNIPKILPGVINAVDFNSGGEGVAYHDVESENTGIPYNGSGYRIPDTEGVDIVGAYAGATAPKIVSQIIEKEWLKYTVNVQSAGDYNFNARVLTQGNGAKFHVEVDDQNVTGTLTYNNTNGAFITVSKTKIPLTAGQHIVKLAFDENGHVWGLGQMDTFSFTVYQPSPTPTPSPTTTPNPTPTPYLGTPFKSGLDLPGKINMVDFDNGGESVAYHDFEPANTGLEYNGGGYRSDDTGVDIVGPYAEAEAPKIVSQTIEKEWLKYTVNVKTAGTYTFNARVLTPGGAGTPPIQPVFHVEVDDNDVTGPISYGPTYTPPASGAFTTVSKPGIPLTAGKHVIKIAFDQNGDTWGLGQWDTFSFN